MMGERKTGVDVVKAFSEGNLRSENDRLRRALKRSGDAAEQHAMNARESDHRIKNSLQIVASLILLQARREDCAPAAESLRAAAARVASIAHIHDALQETGGEDDVDIGAVIESICRSLQAMGGDAQSVNLVVSAQSVDVSVALAQPIALVVNELVINAFRHGFPKDHSGTIRVSIDQAGGELRIVVADDGKGLPAGHGNEHGYGMKLVQLLVSQIDGKLRTESSGGTRFTLVAPLVNTKMLGQQQSQS